MVFYLIVYVLLLLSLKVKQHEQEYDILDFIC